MNSILLLEDEESIRSFIKINLRRAGYNIFEAGCGQEAIDILGKEKINLALLDVMLPDMTGFEVLKQIREQDSEIGVIMLTAKTLQEDKVEGLSLGADDYITKPFDLTELMLRVKGLIKRLKPVEIGVGNKKIKSQCVDIDLGKRSVKVEGKIINLTQTEFEILRVFIENNDVALEKNQMLDLVWGENYFGSINTLDVNISRLRKKLQKTNKASKCIKTVWGYGYKWEED